MTELLKSLNKILYWRKLMFDFGNILIYCSDKQANGTMYSDRLYTWNHHKYDDLCVKYFGNRGQFENQKKLNSFSVNILEMIR